MGIINTKREQSAASSSKVGDRSLIIRQMVNLYIKPNIRIKFCGVFWFVFERAFKTLVDLNFMHVKSPGNVAFMVVRCFDRLRKKQRVIFTPRKNDVRRQ